MITIKELIKWLHVFQLPHAVVVVKIGEKLYFVNRARLWHKTKELQVVMLGVSGEVGINE